MENLSDEEVRLLQSLEDEGLLSKNVVARTQVALRIANAAEKKRVKSVTIVVLILALCGLVSAAIGSSEPWLTTLCFMLAAACLFFAMWCAL
jgi:protein-S-isoprenylcysteine O-methyltransferase Ste14